MALDALELVDKALHWTQFHIVGLCTNILLLHAVINYASYSNGRYDRARARLVVVTAQKEAQKRRATDHRDRQSKRVQCTEQASTLHRKQSAQSYPRRHSRWWIKFRAAGQYLNATYDHY